VTWLQLFNSQWDYIQDGAKAMSGSEDIEFSHAFKQWAEQVENHQYQIFLETAKLVELLKKREVSAKTKNEINIVLKGLQATVKSVSKVLKKCTQVFIE
jgi:hypothetical protein